MQRLYLLLLIAVIVLFAPPLNAEILYVNGATGNDSYSRQQIIDGSGTLAWDTFGRAAWGSATRSASNPSQAAQAGDTVYISEGIYSEPGLSQRYSPVFSPVNSGTLGNPIVFEAVGEVELRFSSGGGSVLGVSSWGDVDFGSVRNYITFKGFTVYEAYAPGVTDGGIAMIAGATGIRIENCKFFGDVSSTLENNHSGIWLTGDSNTVIKNNFISNFLNNGAYHHNAPGVMTYQTTSAIIENNEIDNCGSGVFIKGWDNDSNTIRYNYIRQCGSGVKLMTTIGTHTVYQNIVEGRTGGSPGLAVHPGIDNGLRGTAYLTNNTLINSYINFNYPINSTIIVYCNNNIISYLDGSSYGIEAAFWDRLSQLHFDNNVYYNVSDWYSYNNIQHTVIGSWQNALGGCPAASNDCDSIIASNSLFLDAETQDYRLSVDSVALTAGLDILNLTGGGPTAIIPAGAYITGEEELGIEDGETPTPAKIQHGELHRGTFVGGD